MFNDRREEDSKSSSSLHVAKHNVVEPDDFTTNILNHFRDCPVGNICREDSSIVAFGKSLYQDNRQDRRKVMGPMRLAGRLLERFRVHSANKSASVEEMLSGPNWPHIERAILEMVKNDKEKINVNISHVLRNISRLLLAEVIISNTGGDIQQHQQ